MVSFQSPQSSRSYVLAHAILLIVRILAFQAKPAKLARHEGQSSKLSERRIDLSDGRVEHFQHGEMYTR